MKQGELFTTTALPHASRSPKNSLLLTVLLMQTDKKYAVISREGK